jgi:hypothetical protein
MSRYLTEDDNLRVVEELMKNGGEPMTKEECEKGFEAFSELVILARMVEQWKQGHMQLGWDILTQQLTWSMTDKGNNAVVEAMGS